MNPSTDLDKSLSITLLSAYWNGSTGSATQSLDRAFGGQANSRAEGVSAKKYELGIYFVSAYKKTPPVCTFEFDGEPEENVGYFTRLVSQPGTLSVYAFGERATPLQWQDISTGFSFMCYGPRTLVLR